MCLFDHPNNNDKSLCFWAQEKRGIVFSSVELWFAGQFKICFLDSQGIS